jgi:hypothetical protein
MKKVFIMIAVLYVFVASPAQASNMNKYTDNAKIASALTALANINENDVFNRLDKGSVKIMFYDLSLIDYSYAKHFAVSSTDENGNNYILINERYQGAPKEAIASLIAHESVHVLPQATMDEEVRATTTEAQTWLKLRDNASNSNSELVKRENNLAMMYMASSRDNNLIKSAISGNNFYQRQLAMNH